MLIQIRRVPDSNTKLRFASDLSKHSSRFKLSDTNYNVPITKIDDEEGGGTSTEVTPESQTRNQERRVAGSLECRTQIFGQ